MDVPVWEKYLITAKEAATLTSGWGEHDIRRMAESPECTFGVKHGRFTLIKTKEFREYISRAKVI